MSIFNLGFEYSVMYSYVYTYIYEILSNSNLNSLDIRFNPDCFHHDIRGKGVVGVGWLGEKRKFLDPLE